MISTYANWLWDLKLSWYSTRFTKLMDVSGHMGACDSGGAGTDVTAEPGPPAPGHRLPGSPHGRGLAERVGGAVQRGHRVHVHRRGRWRWCHVARGRGGGGQRWAGWARRRCVGGGCSSLHVVESVAQVGHELSAQPHVHTRDRSQAAGNFVGSMSESSTEAVSIHGRVQWQAALTAELVKVANGQFQNIGFLQFCNIFSFRLKSADHQLLEFVEAAVDASAPFALKHRLHHFAVLISTRDWLRAVVCERVRDLVRHVGHLCVASGGVR